MKLIDRLMSYVEEFKIYSLGQIFSKKKAQHKCRA